MRKNKNGFNTIEINSDLWNWICNFQKQRSVTQAKVETFFSSCFIFKKKFNFKNTFVHSVNFSILKFGYKELKSNLQSSTK